MTSAAQAEDRIHRMGQARRPTYGTVCCAKSIDERISRALACKEDILMEFLAEVNKVRDKRADGATLKRMIREL